MPVCVPGPVDDGIPCGAVVGCDALVAVLVVVAANNGLERGVTAVLVVVAAKAFECDG